MNLTANKRHLNNEKNISIPPHAIDEY